MTQFLYGKLRELKIKADEFKLRCEDLSTKYNTESSVKCYLAGKLKDLEKSQVKISTDIIQQRKAAIVLSKYTNRLQKGKPRN